MLYPGDARNLASPPPLLVFWNPVFDSRCWFPPSTRDFVEHPSSKKIGAITYFKYLTKQERDDSLQAATNDVEEELSEGPTVPTKHVQSLLDVPQVLKINIMPSVVAFTVVAVVGAAAAFHHVHVTRYFCKTP